MTTNHISLEFKGKTFLHPKSRDEKIADFSKCQSVCSKYNATTVKIHSKEENEFFWSFIKDHFNQTNDQVWLRVKFFDPTDNLIWLDNSTVDYTNWSPGEPNFREEKCVTMWGSWGWPSYWNNFLCENYDGSDGFGYVQYIACERII
jgi:hypothetical protein